MVQLSLEPSVEKEDVVNLPGGGGDGTIGSSGSPLMRGALGLTMTQSTQLKDGGNNNNSGFNRYPQDNISSSAPGKGYANGDVLKNGYLRGSPSSRGSSSTPVTSHRRPPPAQDAAAVAATRETSVRTRREMPSGGGERPRPHPPHTTTRDRRSDPRDQYPRDRWSYYGDPRVRADQQFLRDDRSRDERSRRDERDRRDAAAALQDDRDRRRDRRDRPGDDRYRPPESSSRSGNRDRYPACRERGSEREKTTTLSSRDPEIEGGRERGSYSSRDNREQVADGYYLEDVPEAASENHQSTGAEDGRSEAPVERSDGEREDSSSQQDPDGSDQEDNNAPDRDKERPRNNDGDHRQGRDRSYERRRRREYDRERDRSYERERERDRDLGRDRDHQPLRREPVGEETGYDSDHSRVSRSTAVSYSTRSLGRRPRADSVASHASMASHMSARPPPAPARTPRGARGYDDSYGSRELYDQYQYYYQYYQGHPYYKEYYRQWMKQYGHAYQSHESFYDDRTSIHSGRSSVNDELKKSISSPRAAYDPYGYYYGHATQPPHSSSQFMQDFHGRSSVGPYEPSAIYPDGSYSQMKSYASGELSGVPSVGGDSASEAPQRLTPVQHGLPHINARFTPGGQLLLVLPKDPRDGEKAVVQIRDVQKMLSIDPSLNRCIWQMKSYPGPLTLADTHKDVVVRYCEQQAAGAAKNQALPDGESITLIWEYLALLVKQNGKLYGSDVAGLLLKGQDRLSQPQHSASHSSPEDDAEVSSSDGSPQDEGIDMQLQSTPVLPPRDEVALLKKFTEYLCLGRKKEAVDYAMREGLWGHALALSYKMDSTTHTRVLAAFSNSIPRNDVLLTLFQQLSGKRPEVAKNYTPQQWGNWRQHLAMMISNPTGQSQRDKASVVALGETLASRGQLHAAHFCYLVAETEWGSFSNKESKLVLIGASHNLPFQAFATNEAIQCTEIYEFARSLEPSNPVLEKFQSYKLIYALRLAEFGFPSEALRYCEVISQIVSKDPHTYQGDFLAQVYELGLRLKYHDLHYQMYEGEVAEIPDPQWLTNLASLVAIVRQQEAEQAPSQSTHEYQSNTQDYSSANTHQGSSTTPDLYSQNMQTTTDSYSLGYGGVDTSHQQGQATPDLSKGHPVSADAMDGGYHQQLIPTYPLASGTPNEGATAQAMQSESGHSVDSTSHIQESSSPHSENVPMMMQPQNQVQYGGYGSNYWPGYTQPDVGASPSYKSPESADVSHSSLPASPEVSSEQRSNSDTSMTQPNSLGSYPPYQQPYQPWDQQHQHPGSSIDADQPQSSSPEPPQNSGAQRTAEEEAYWAEMTGKKTSKDMAEPTSKENENSEDSQKNKEKNPDPSQEKSTGWSIGSLFRWKTNTKQAVLPDDKNPSIVWNEEKKRWENKDGEEELNNPPPPPPKSATGGPGAPPMFLGRAGPRKSRYVNTEKDSSKQPLNGPNPMLNPLGGNPPMPGGPMPIPSGAPTPPSFMVPGPGSEGSSSSQQPPPNMQQIEQQPPPQQPLPQVPPTSLPDSSLGTSSDGAEGPVPMMAPPGQPQFFNPSQFNPTTSSNPAQTKRVGPGKRLYQGKR